MDEAFARRLCALNRAFYEREAASFSHTRHAPWAGWRRCLDSFGGGAPEAHDRSSLRVLDVGCGNLRFEGFLEARFPDARIEARALDACAALAPANFAQEHPRVCVDFEECDVMGLLAEGQASAVALNRAFGVAGEGTLSEADASADTQMGFDLAVAFGFMHHIPLPAWRDRLLQALVCALAPGGIACVSFWRFMDDAGLAAKARVTHELGCAALGLDVPHACFAPGDYLLGWQHDDQAFRYCHSFTDAEIDALVRVVEARGVQTVARFRADGRTGALNEYVVLRRA